MHSSTVSRLAFDQKHERTGIAYVLLYLPALLAWLVVSSAVLSFSVAWMGSWWILWISMTGRVRSWPQDRPIAGQLFRPLFLSQLMFFGLFCLGPVFYMWDLATASNFAHMTGAEIERTAAAQRYYVLGHAAFVHGILVFMNYRRSGTWSLRTEMPLSQLFLYAAGATIILAVFFSWIPGMGQFEGKCRNLAAVAAVLAGAYSFRRGSFLMTIVGLGLSGYMLAEVFLSGWKHRIILVVGLLLFALYPRYKKTVGILGIAVVIGFITILPAYNSIFRELNWKGNVGAQKAAQIAVRRVMSGDVNIEKASWTFLKGRLSTVSLFTDYIQSTPSRNPYYGLTTVEQALQAIIPRVLWPEKPNTEKAVMQRVYENTDIRRASGVSAKPLVVVDGYLAGGIIGVFFACFLLGCVASAASRYTERWFGGYEIGGQLVYTALFARTLFIASFEFLFNALFWSFVLVFIFAHGLRVLGFLEKRGIGRTRSAKTVPASKG